VAEETEVPGENLPQGHFVHHKSHKTRPGLEPGPVQYVIVWSWLCELLGLTQPEAKAHGLHHLIELTREVEGHLVRKYMNSSSSVQLQESIALLADPDSLQ
jgi:hypothetical protein